jgi:hypothetical protein
MPADPPTSRPPARKRSLTFAGDPLATTERAPSSSSAWFPSPQPSVTISSLESSQTTAALCFATSWYYMTASAFASSSILAALATCLFLLATLLFMASAHRLTAEFTRESPAYNIPLGRRASSHHRSVRAAVLAFYLGLTAQLGVSAWAASDSKRGLAAVAIAAFGGLAIVVGGVVHHRLLTTPLGRDTTHIYGRGRSANLHGYGSAHLSRAITGEAEAAATAEITGFVRTPAALPIPVVTVEVRGDGGVA